MRVTVHCAAASADAPAVGGLALKCTPSERKVWVERGSGAGRKIAFSSTYDGVVDGDAPQALYDAAIAPAVAAATADKVGCVLCVGTGAGKRAAFLGTAAEVAIAKLLQAADEKGLELTIAAVLVMWERLTDLIDGSAIEPGATATGGGDGAAQSPAALFGASTRVLASASAASGALRDVEAAAAAAEAAAVGVGGGGHVALQLTLGEGRLLLVDAADLAFAEDSSAVLASTLCHHSHAMLSKCLAKPSTRPALADTALLPRLLGGAFFDGGASARLVLHVPPTASQVMTTDCCRLPPIAADGLAGKSFLRILARRLPSSPSLGASPPLAGDRRHAALGAGGGQGGQV